MSFMTSKAILQIVRRSFHTTKLDTRGLIAIYGTDASAFLQGLITNDVCLLGEQKQPVPAIYSLMLNVQGRVINDFVVFNLKNKADAFPDNSYLLDTDLSLIPQTIALFKKFRLRRKLEISDVSKQYSQYSLWDFKSTEKAFPQLDREQKLFVGNDPRLASLGKRLLTQNTKDHTAVEQISNKLDEKAVYSSHEQWKVHRYQFAVPEGAVELPPGKCLPLESNCDFLKGVSFSKGCYVGQELTARTHNIGVTRKRLLPIKFDGTVLLNAKLFSESDGGLKPVGEVRTISGNCGLALVRIQSLSPTTNSAKLFSFNEQTQDKTVCQVRWPDWFPPLKSILDKTA